MKSCIVLVITLFFYFSTNLFCFELNDDRKCSLGNAIKEMYNSLENVCHEKTRTEDDKIQIRRKSQQACVSYRRDFYSGLQYRSMRNVQFSYYILGGESAKAAEFPHMAALGFYNEDTKLYQFDCGGTLISPKYVVSAAHCIRNLDGSELKIVRIGSIFVPPTTEKVDIKVDHEVKNVTVHPEYQRRKHLNDIALVELTEMVFFTESRRPACLYTEKEHPNELEITGWGNRNFNRGRTSVLYKAKVLPVPLQKCLELYSTRHNLKVNSGHICAGNDTTNTCQGDSGGPLQTKLGDFFYLVGVTSYGEICGSRLPGIYTKISSYLDWIEDIVWP